MNILREFEYVTKRVSVAVKIWECLGLINQEVSNSVR